LLILTPKKVIETIRTARKRKGLRQIDMAEKLSINLLAYQRLERGVTKLDVDRLIKITEILGLKLTIE